MSYDPDPTPSSDSKKRSSSHSHFISSRSQETSPRATTSNSVQSKDHEVPSTSRESAPGTSSGSHARLDDPRIDLSPVQPSTSTTPLDAEAAWRPTLRIPHPLADRRSFPSVKRLEGQQQPQLLLQAIPETSACGPKSRKRSSASIDEPVTPEIAQASVSVIRPTTSPTKRGRRPLKLDMKSKLEKSRQSARECRARKKLRYQYLEELVAAREKAIFSLREELETYKSWCKEVDEGRIPPDVKAKMAKLEKKLIMPGQEGAGDEADVGDDDVDDDDSVDSDDDVDSEEEDEEEEGVKLDGSQ